MDSIEVPNLLLRMVTREDTSFLNISILLGSVLDKRELDVFIIAIFVRIIFICVYMEV